MGGEGAGWVVAGWGGFVVGIVLVGIWGVATLWMCSGCFLIVLPTERTGKCNCECASR